MDIDTAEALWVLGLLPESELPRWAASAIEAGLEAPSLAMLASLSSGDTGLASRMFNRVLGETRPTRLGKEEALRLYAKAVSQQIIASEVPPSKGARWIWRAVSRAAVPDFHELDTFIYAASELDDRPEDHELFTRGILGEARRWAQYEYRPRETGGPSQP